MRNIRVATAGCGYFSQFHHAAWQRLEVDLAGICDTDLSRAHSFADRYGGAMVYNDYREMLEQCQPDIVDIILPPVSHLEHIKIACEYGMTVICQKPFTESIEQALLVHENFRFQPWYRKIRQLVCENKFGQVYQFRFNLRPGDGQGDNAYLDRQPYFQQMKKFLIRETGIHFIDVFRFLAGEVHSVWADLRQLNPAIQGEDAGIFVLEFDNQVRGIFDGNRLSDHIAENKRLTMGEFCIEGESGTLDLTGAGNLFFREKGSNRATQINYDWADTGFGGDCVYALQKHVLDHIQHGSNLENNAAEYLINLEIQELVYRSDQQGKRLLL
jgi:predicted dehydrogenase